MSSQWYCTDCETYIETEEIDEHESDGHTVKGTVRPDRLLGNDPWNMQVEADGEIDTAPAVPKDEGGEE